MKKTIKYLELMVDNKLTFKEHLKYTEEKMITRIPILQKLARNLYGHSFKARKIKFFLSKYSLLIGITNSNWKPTGI